MNTAEEVALQQARERLAVVIEESVYHARMSVFTLATKALNDLDARTEAHVRYVHRSAAQRLRWWKFKTQQRSKP